VQHAAKIASVPCAFLSPESASCSSFPSRSGTTATHFDRTEGTRAAFRYAESASGCGFPPRPAGCLKGPLRLACRGERPQPFFQTWDGCLVPIASPGKTL
jgi:hypothetical protein